MKKTILMASGLALMVFGGQASAQYYYSNSNSNQYTTTVRYNTDIQAGPSYSYPQVGFLQSGQRVQLHGCLNEYSWCDISFTTRTDRYARHPEVYVARGWVMAENLNVWRNNRAYDFYSASSWYHYPIVSFVFDQYWRQNYSRNNWYSNRDRYRSYDYRQSNYRWQGNRNNRNWNNRNRWDGRDDYRTNRGWRDGDQSRTQERNNHWRNNDQRNQHEAGTGGTRSFTPPTAPVRSTQPVRRPSVLGGQQTNRVPRIERIERAENRQSWGGQREYRGKIDTTPQAQPIVSPQPASEKSDQRIKQIEP